LGELRFSYLDEVNRAGEQFVEPEQIAYPPAKEEMNTTVFWPFFLLDNQDSDMGNTVSLEETRIPAGRTRPMTPSS
jgi:hypothetical protein